MLVGLVPGPACAQARGVAVTVGEDRPVGGGDGRAYTEPSIAAHPDDPGVITIAAIAGFTRRAGAPGWNCASWSTGDGGRSWRPRDIDVTQCADPSVVYDASGGLHVAVLGDGGGVTLLAPARRGDWERQRLPGSDRPILAAAPDALHLVTTSTRRQGGELIAGMAAMRSEDGAETFEPVLEIFDAGTRHQGIAPAVLSDGTVLYGASTYAGSRGGRMAFFERGRAWSVRGRGAGVGERVSIAHDCQNRVGMPTLVAGAGTAYLVCVGAGAEDLLVYSSEDRGRTWSGPTGVLGVVWQDREDDPRRRCQRLMFAASADDGATFTAPVAVSSEPSCPDNRSNVEAGRQWPGGTDYGTIAAAADGRFVTAWADARDGAYRIRTAPITVEVTGR